MWSIGDVPTARRTGFLYIPVTRVHRRDETPRGSVAGETTAEGRGRKSPINCGAVTKYVNVTASDRLAGRTPAMRRVLIVLFALTGLLLGLTGPASAESITVKGTGNITKMSVNNGDNKITVKVYGLDKPCEAKSLWVTVSSRETAKYRAEASCYQGWHKGLYLYSSGDTTTGGKRVTCDGFVLKYVTDGKFYKIVMPRSCVGKLPNKIRVAAEGVDFDSAMPGFAGPTKLLARG
jgi:hypothetical protein